MLSHTYASKDAPIALQKIKEYAARQPKSADIQNFLGICYGPGDRVGARKAFEKAKDGRAPIVSTSDLSIWFSWMSPMARIDDSRKRLEDVFARSPGNPKATYCGWASWIRPGETTSRPLNISGKRVEANPGDAQALNNLAYELIEHGNQPDEALKYAQKAVELSPENPTYADTLGWILYNKGLYTRRSSIWRGLQPNLATLCGSIIWRWHMPGAGEAPAVMTTWMLP